MTTRINPYVALRDKCARWARDVLYPRRVEMFTYPRNKLQIGWNLVELYERTRAADQLGYDVVLSTTTETLVVTYRKRPPTPPYEIAP
jgi:hypothetical protein